MKEYIEREPILKDIEEMLNAVRQHVNITGRGSGKTLWEGIGRGIIYCSKKLLAAPAADVVEVRHGRWLLERTPDGKPYCFHCSVCDDDFHHIGIMTVYDYCPNCGAYMMGESNGKCE